MQAGSPAQRLHRRLCSDGSGGATSSNTYNNGQNGGDASDWASIGAANAVVNDSYDAFVSARALGYRGISSKSCKGIYKSMINATRAAKWTAAGEKCFIAGEDLTCQAGLGVQQDLALGALIGITHAERNGHHYVDGFGDTPAAEAQAFLAAHPDLYVFDANRVRLSIRDGDLLTGLLTAPGFASKVHPVWSVMSPLEQPKARILKEQAI